MARVFRKRRNQASDVKLLWSPRLWDGVGAVGGEALKGKKDFERGWGGVGWEEGGESPCWWFNTGVDRESNLSQGRRLEGSGERLMCVSLVVLRR